MSLRQASANLFRGFLRCSHSLTDASFRRTPAESGKLKVFDQSIAGGVTWGKYFKGAVSWIFLSGQAALILGINASPIFAEDVSTKFENDTSRTDITGLRKIDDGSVISNMHTAKWRVFTDNGRKLFLQGKLEEAENSFMSALEEAKEGFGVRDPHVASSCNNLAELYRVRKAFDKAEPLYVEAIDILKESFGPEDIRVGAALHNLGQFYLVQRNLEQARHCYERALKIKKRILGENHIDYADTMYHLGTVLYRQGKEKDSEALIKDSIRILEGGGLGESNVCINRLRYLAQVYINSNRPEEAENIQRKILHVMELSKGWNSLSTVIAAESLALTFQSLGRLREALELLQRCLDARKILIPKVHIQIAANMLHIARVKMLISNQIKKKNSYDAIQELDMAKDLLHNSARIAQQLLVEMRKQEGKQLSFGENGKDRHAVLVVMLQSLKTLGMVEINKLELQKSGEHHLSVAAAAAESALNQCIAAFKEFGTEGSILSSTEVKSEYLSCLKHLCSLTSDAGSIEQRRTATLDDLKTEIRRIEAEIASHRKHRKQ